MIITMNINILSKASIVHNVSTDISFYQENFADFTTNHHVIINIAVVINK